MVAAVKATPKKAIPPKQWRPYFTLHPTKKHANNIVDKLIGHEIFELETPCDMIKENVGLFGCFFVIIQLR